MVHTLVRHLQRDNNNINQDPVDYRGIMVYSYNSLSHSQRFSRIVPEGEYNNNFKSNPGSNDSGLDDSFFQSQIEQEANDYGRYRYDMRYYQYI